MTSPLICMKAGYDITEERGDPALTRNLRGSVGRHSEMSSWLCVQPWMPHSGAKALSSKEGSGGAVLLAPGCWVPLRFTILLP